MVSSVLKSLYRRLDVRSLGTKILLPSVALVLLTVVGEGILFAGGTHLTRRSRLEQQMSNEADYVVEAIDQRAQAVSHAGQILADDLGAAYALRDSSDVARRALSDRAQVVQDRFDLALVQIYDQRGVAQVDVVLSSLCLDASATSSLLNLAEPERLVARAVDHHVLLLSQTPLLEGTGMVVVGIDLETELKDIRNKHGLSTDLGLALRGTRIGTTAGLPFDAQRGWVGDQYCRKRSIMLGNTPGELLLVRPGGDVKQTTRAALFVAAGSTLFATLLLSSLHVAMIRSMGFRMCTLSAAMEAAGHGDLEQKVHLAPNALTIGEDDELGLLANAFNRMASNLRDLCSDLEAEAEAHTAGLAIAAGVSGAVSSGLQLDTVLRRSAQIILERLDHVCPGVYHVGIFLLEEGSETIVLQEVASEARGNLGRGTVRVPVGSQSPVGLAVATRRTKVIQDVRLMPAHLKPPLLMDTYSAVAVPLLSGDRLIGALDVQSKQPGAFPSDTLQLLDTLASQIATAVHNARLYQHQRQAAEHLGQVDQLKTQFLAMVSHKLRAPLNTITGLSGGLLEGKDSSLSSQQEQDISLIRSLGQHLLELTDDFLDISKLTAGTITLNLQDVNLRLLMESSLDAVAPLIENKPITLRAEVDTCPPVVRADKRRIRQVMLNLLSNAVAFTEAGHIDVHARGIEALNVDTGREEPFVEIRISDTGLAISKGELMTGFRVLEHLDRQDAGAPVSKCIAAGFGLPITEALVDLHGGRIWVDDDSGEGVTFTVILPVNRPETEQPQPI